MCGALLENMYWHDDLLIRERIDRSPRAVGGLGLLRLQRMDLINRQMGGIHDPYLLLKHDESDD